MAGAMWTCSLNALIPTQRHILRTGDPARLPAVPWGQMNWNSGKKCYTGPTKEAKAGQKSLVPSWQVQQINQGRTSFVCTLWVPIQRCFNSQQGPPLSRLSVPSTSQMSRSRGLRTVKVKKNLYLRFKLCAKNLVFSSVINGHLSCKKHVLVRSICFLSVTRYVLVLASFFCKKQCLSRSFYLTDYLCGALFYWSAIIDHPGMAA